MKAIRFEPIRTTVSEFLHFLDRIASSLLGVEGKTFVWSMAIGHIVLVTVLTIQYRRARRHERLLGQPINKVRLAWLWFIYSKISFWTFWLVIPHFVNPLILNQTNWRYLGLAVGTFSEGTLYLAVLLTLNRFIIQPMRHGISDPADESIE